MTMLLRRSASATIVLLAGMAITLAAEGPAERSRQPTVGDLARALAQLAGAAGPAGARVDTRLLGSVRERYDEPLSEGAAAALLKLLGTDVKTSAPGRLMTPGRTRALLRQVEGTLQPGAVSGDLVSSAVSLVSMDDCLASSNHGECVECCKALGGTASNCAKQCFIINKPSASEPLP